ncbi:MAG: nucleotidyl transferase AbiEii/AbiGii toxin family protein [Candidatus Micrarchaeota archaeon]
MISAEDLKVYAKTFKMKSWQIEKEYFQHLLLSLIYSRTSALLFKGGTAIKKAYGLKRFSEDLDFTQISDVDCDALLGEVSKILFSKFGYVNTLKKIKVKEQIGSGYRFSIKGPLAEQSELGICHIYVDVSRRETPKTKEVVAIKSVYPDLPDYEVIIMSRDEIVAEKIRAILMRDRPRDLYDLHHLLLQDISINYDWVNDKMRYYNKSFSKDEFLDCLEKYRKLWKELPHLIADVPEFDEVLKFIHLKFTPK